MGERVQISGCNATENRNAGKHCESSGEIRDEVVWACGEGERDVVR